MNVASVTAPRWAVSTRTRGEVLVAGVSAPGLEIVLLGVPSQITTAEAEDWLRDLTGVAHETAGAEQRELAIPALLYHALAGLLFSQTHLWTSADAPSPCSVVFVETPLGAAFGWVGEALVQVAVDGEPIEPQWVVVRDEDGREARAGVLAAHGHAQVLVEYSPGDAAGAEPPAAVEADWLRDGRDRAPAAASAPAPGVSEPQAPAEPAAITHASVAHLEDPLAAHDALVAQAIAAHEAALAEANAAEVSPAPALPELVDANLRGGPSPGEPDVVRDDADADADAGMDPDADDASSIAAGDDETNLTPEQSLAFESLTVPRESHPVARWLGRIMGFARRMPAAVRRPAPTPDHESTPLSTYDLLLSEHVPETPALEQTSLALPASAPPVHTPAPAPRVAPAPVAAPPVVVARPAPPVIAPHVVASPAPEASPPAPALESARDRLVRAMHAADTEALPVLHVPQVKPPGAGPLSIDREPVGADAAFGIPSIASRRLPGQAAPPARPAPAAPAAAATPPAVPPAPPAPPASAPARPAPPPKPAPAPLSLVVPETPRVLKVRPAAGPPPTPPKLSVIVSGRPEPAPPVMRVPGPNEAGSSELNVEPVSVPPRAIDAAPPMLQPLDEAEHAASGLTSVPARRRWPVLEEPPKRRIVISRRGWALIAIVVAVFASGWIVGVIANPDPDQPGPVTRLLRVVGLGGSHYTIVVNSTPGGAWITVDGKDAAKRTPAAVEVSPGAHLVTLSMPELGSVQVPVRGRGGDRVTVAPSLNGALQVQSSDAGVPIKVSLDGRPLGYAPLQVDALAPGLHEVQFSGPGMPAWAQTVQVGIRQTAELVAHPMSAPATGVIDVQASLNDEQGAAPLSGAQVWVDGELRAVTPASLTLARGPHSLKLTWKGQAAPVQVIDLPGGNQRFATFAFGLDDVSPQINLLGGVHPSSAQKPAIVSAALAGLQVGDVREAWLHVRMPDGLWRRYPMTAARGLRGTVVTSAFPPSGFDTQGQSRWYVSTSTMQGDEFFSEMQVASVGGAAVPAPRPKSPAAAAASPTTAEPAPH